MLLWLRDRSQAATRFAAQFLLRQTGTGTDIHGAPTPYTGSGLRAVHAGEGAARYFGVPARDSRVPDLFGITQRGVVYTGGQGKIAEHGGTTPEDRHVPLLVVLPNGPRGLRVGRLVETTQIAPTILAALGLSPAALQAVRIEHTAPLPR